MDNKETYLREFFQLKAQVKKKGMIETQKQYNCTNKQFLQILKQVESKGNKKIEIDQNEQKQLISALQRGRNVCVFGRGSKISFLTKFIKKIFYKSNIFVVRGYHSNLNQKIIINNFGKFLESIKVLNRCQKLRMTDQVKQYKQALQKTQHPVVVVFHNIDGINILNYQAQLILSELFRSENIQLIASIDNIKIVMNWSPDTINNYRFNFFHISTEQPYIDELKYSVQKLRKKDKQQQALKYIWASLNPNQKQILKVMARKQLKNLMQGTQQYYSFHELYEICVSQIILSSEYQLRQNLIELLDHKVIEQKTYEQKNKKVYTMKFQRKMLDQILDNK